MTEYDPKTQPDARIWLDLDERERIHAVEEFHRNAKIKLPNLKVHAVFHTVVENQLAEALDPIVRAMVRLRKEGLSRHDSIHAIATILAEHMHDLFNDKATAENSQTIYYAAIEKLDAQSWREG
jgi:alpha-beta hydrolase superfamily lysophospholipase